MPELWLYPVRSWWNHGKQIASAAGHERELQHKLTRWISKILVPYSSRLDYTPALSSLTVIRRGAQLLYPPPSHQVCIVSCHQPHATGGHAPASVNSSPTRNVRVAR
jgi:hypothetical protein